VTDIWNAEKRSAVMARIRGKDTKPELIVRSLLHRAGVGFSLRRKDLAGKRNIYVLYLSQIIGSICEKIDRCI
jgi:DNA mismatch endonuclease, patch repair protein